MSSHEASGNHLPGHVALPRANDPSLLGLHSKASVFHGPGQTSGILGLAGVWSKYSADM